MTETIIYNVMLMPLSSAKDIKVNTPQNSKQLTNYGHNVVYGWKCLSGGEQCWHTQNLLYCYTREAVVKGMIDS